MTMQGKIRTDEVQEGDKLINMRGQVLAVIEHIVAIAPDYLVQLIGQTPSGKRYEVKQRGDVLVDVQRD